MALAVIVLGRRGVRYDLRDHRPDVELNDPSLVVLVESCGSRGSPDALIASKLDDHRHPGLL
jgi:hypothetical protein